MLLEFIVTYRLDAVIATLASIGILIAASKWTHRRTNQRLAWSVYLPVAAFIATACIIAEFEHHAAKTDLRDRINSLGSLYADGLERLGHSKIQLNTSADDPRYLSMIEAQILWLKSNPMVGDVYTVRPKGNEYVLIVGSETDFDHDGRYQDQAEVRSAIGESFDAPSLWNLQRAMSGEGGFDQKPIHDRWGTWFIAYYPLRDSSGNIEGVVGFQFAAIPWLISVAWHRSLPLGAAILLSSIFAFSAAMVRALRNEIDQRVKAEEALRRSESHMTRLALEDRLTRLPNRRFIQDALATAVTAHHGASHSPENRETFAVLHVEIDHFKAVNDGFGHTFGDEMLMTVAKRLRNASAVYEQNNPSDRALPARLAGAEFVILTRGRRAAANARAFAEQLQQALSAPYELGNRQVVRAVNIGIATSATGEYTSAEEVLRDADTAVLTAKNRGSGNITVLDAHLRMKEAEKLALETDLRQAIQRHELVLHFQPIVCLKTGKLVGFESLMRWNHSTRGMISPMLFIPMAEETGLIVAMGLWALEESARQLAIWQARYPKPVPLTMSVNVSRKQLAIPDLSDQIARRVLASGIVTGSLGLEITESVVMDDPDVAANAMAKFREHGIPIYMDDFGTGHSSLSCLHRFRCDVLKLDRAFMQDADSRRDYVAILQATVQLAKDMGMILIAEGIETIEHVSLLQTLGCDRGQGYLFSKPLSAEQAEEYIEEKLGIAVAA